MATKTIAWEIGGGYITLTFTGTGNSSVSVTSSENDTFDEREQTVCIMTTAGFPTKSIDLLIRQNGKKYPVGKEFNFDYTGSVQQITLPTGKYKLQCWGAQGGGITGDYEQTGSKGGYSEGIITLTRTTTFYVFVGGKGETFSTSLINGIVNGGWNGGGSSVRYSSYNYDNEYGKSFPRPGGGATDICIRTSTMNYVDNVTKRTSESLLSRFIVAGGGAGASAGETKAVTEFNPIAIKETVDSTIEQGTWLESSGCRAPGNHANNYIRIRTNNVVNSEIGCRYKISVNSGYQIFLIYFSNYVNNSIGYIGNTVSEYYGWQQTFNFISRYKYFAIVIRKITNATITPNDSHGLKIEKNYYTESSSTTQEEIPKTIESGTWSENNGSRCSDALAPTFKGLRLRTNDAISLIKGVKYKLSINSGYKFFIIFFSKFVTNELDNMNNDVGEYINWSQSLLFFADYDDMAIIIKKTDGTAISVNDNYELSIIQFTPEQTEEISFSVSDANQEGGGITGKGQYPGTQKSSGYNGSFGIGASQKITNYRYCSGAGGGGWYGGGSDKSDSYTNYVNYSGGGSGFINTADNADICPSGYTGLPLDSGYTCAGDTSFPSPFGGNEIGHSGNGYARITVLA